MMINQKQRDKLAFNLAKEYLLNPKKYDNRGRVTKGLLERYLRPDERPRELAEIYKQMLESALGFKMVSRVVKLCVGEISSLRRVLCEFEPARISERYKGPEELLAMIVKEFNLTGRIRTWSNDIFPKFCRTALDAATFLRKFQGAESFYEWADEFDCDPRARPALPLIIESHVNGYGFALACNFIKELGFENFAKPDVQLMDIFAGLGLSDDKDPYKVFCDIVRVAKHAGRTVTPFAVDKVFWLIGTGNFYKDDFKVKSHMRQFITYAKRELSHLGSE